MCEILGEEEEFFQIVERFRHAYVHGDDLELLERETGKDLGDIVDRLGNLALDASIRTVQVAQEGFEFNFRRPKSFQRQEIRAKVHVAYKPSGRDLEEPDPMKIPKANVKLALTPSSETSESPER